MSSRRSRSPVGIRWVGTRPRSPRKAIDKNLVHDRVRRPPARSGHGPTRPHRVPQGYDLLSRSVGSTEWVRDLCLRAIRPRITFLTRLQALSNRSRRSAYRSHTRNRTAGNNSAGSRARSTHRNNSRSHDSRSCHAVQNLMKPIPGAHASRPITRHSAVPLPGAA